MRKRNENVTDFDSYVYALTGLHINELDSKSEDQYRHPALEDVARVIRFCVQEGRKICIVGDYDADGIMSICILSCLMIKIGADYSITVPKRFSEGYGLSDKIIDRLPNGCLLLTVDNGIAAVEQIRKAKEKEIDTVILDHHNAGDELPEAYIIADPKVITSGFSFHDYCGAGLAYKLATELIKDAEPAFMDQLAAFAAVATIADVMPLVGDNRNIVKRGLKVINERRCLPGMATLAGIMYEGVYESDDIAFKLAPAINAPGRLEDNGGEAVVKCMLLNSDKFALEIKEFNDTRRALTEKALKEVTPVGNNISFVYSPEIPEGLCGLIAGKVAEKTGKPSFVATSTEDGTIKGSARAAGEENIFEIMSKAKDKYIAFGGHNAAAGFSFKKDNLDDVVNILDIGAKGVEAVKQDEFYDFDISQSDLPRGHKEFSNIKPFGEGLPNPLIRTRITVDSFAYVGKEGSTLQLRCPDMRFVGFSLSEEYKTLGEPKELTVYGRYATNYYNGNAYPQMIVEAIAL